MLSVGQQVVHYAEQWCGKVGGDLSRAAVMGLTDAELRALCQRLRGFAAVVAPGEVGPDDLLQEALEKFLGLRYVAIAEPEAYLRQMILNLALNHRRGLGRRHRAYERLARQPIYQGADVGYLDGIPHIEKLTPLQRAVLYSHYVEGFDFISIADRFGLSHSVIRQTAHRARRKLRRWIEEGNQKYGSDRSA